MERSRKRPQKGVRLVKDDQLGQPQSALQFFIPAKGDSVQRSCVCVCEPTTFDTCYSTCTICACALSRHYMHGGTIDYGTICRTAS